MSQSVEPARETKSQKAERLKREKNPWHGLEEIRRFAREGHGSIPDDWKGTYFKWWGIYSQGNGQGAFGDASVYFMLRIGLPNGIATSEQLRATGRLAKRFARNQAAITVRQSLQFHWVEIESVPDIIESLEGVGLTCKGTSGDSLRGVTGCPLSGCLDDELLDTRPLVRQIAKELAANADFYNLPRKIKVAVSGCPSWCSHPEINDLGLTAVRNGEQLGYSIRVGGGLSRQPHFGVKLNAFVRQEQAAGVVRAVMELFRRQDVLREKRESARLKYLFLKHGWTGERFLGELEEILGYKLAPAVAEDVPGAGAREHLGVHPQKQRGRYAIGIPVPGGVLTGDQLIEIARLVELYAGGEVRFSVGQNMLIPHVPEQFREAFARELEGIGLSPEVSSFRTAVVSCTGKEFCKMGIAETKGFSRRLIGEMERRMPGFSSGLSIHVTGCSHGCAHHHVSDIGLEGRKLRKGSDAVDGFAFRLGGSLGDRAMLGRAVGYQCATDDVPEAIERLLRGYMERRLPGEALRSFLQRSNNETLCSLLAGVAQ